MKGVHICRFDSAEDITGKKRTYEAVKQRVLECGRFSIFEATASRKNIALFTSLDHDPELEVTIDHFPWYKVRLREHK